MGVLGRLILLGSGETSPSMVSYYQRSIPKDARVGLLDSSYGFQANADDLTEKIVGYFRESVGFEISPIQLRSSESSSLEVATARSSINSSEFVLAGPGSPTYALNVWSSTNLAPDFLRLLERGTLLLASAAALTAGAFTIPVYEIYKVGEKPSWREGLNIFASLTGVNAAIVPHFNNAEGGRHDTRCCYIGEARLSVLEKQLPAEAVILGIDEHTGIELDIAKQEIVVFGRGGLTVRNGAGENHFVSGSVLKVADLQSIPSERPSSIVEAPTSKIASDLLRAGDVEGAVAAAVEDLDIDRLHAFIVQLAHHMSMNSSDDATAPLIDFLMQLRNEARAEKRWQDSDRIRDLLDSIGIELQDSASGTVWVKK
ncbi:MAG: hypothetical protein RIS43_704 [Actinomycetota bacterium]|jgi:peptidase E